MSYIDKLRDLGIVLSTNGRQTCPVCSETRTNSKDKCVNVSFTGDGIKYHCHHCNEFKGVVQYEDKVFVKTERVFTRPQKAVCKQVDSQMIEYFKNRSISSDTLKKYNVELSTNNNIVFNYFKEGELVNKKGRSFDKKLFLQDKNAEQVFYGMDLVEDTKELIIVEGEIDVLSFYEAGYYAVSVPNGGSDTKLECIENCWGWLKQFDTFILATDNDEVGRKLKHNLIDRLGKARCKEVDFSKYKTDEGEPCKDANDLLVVDVVALKELIKNAKYLPVDCVSTFGANRKQILDFYRNGYEQGTSTGWKSLDKLFTVHTGRLMIITGIPTRGKSFFADNMLFNLTKNNQWKHLILSLENSIENHFTRFASMLTEKGFKKQYNDYISEAEVNGAIDYFDEYIYRMEIDRMWTVDEIIQEAEILVKRFGIKTLTIDPYNKLSHKYTQREDRYVGEILSKLSMFAKANNVLVIFIAHPKKMRDKEDIPNAYDISGSSDWYNMADYLLTIHRERGGDGKLLNEPWIYVQKVKDFALGDPSGGKVRMLFNVQTYKIEEHYINN